MWENMIEHLNDPLLVVKVQNFFGVIYKRSSRDDSSEVIRSDRLETEDRDIKQHKRIPSNTSSSSQSSSSTDSSTGAREEIECQISNKLWYYLFVIGTALGDEIFYATFIPFWFWNVDGAVGRRVVLVWSIVMYIGQGFKDIIRWPRPGYPVKKLQSKWAIEYGMPSTHAMVGVSMPFSVLLYTMDRYQYPAQWGVLIAVTWCTLICVSRVYLGMHSVLDIAAGLLLASVLLVPLVPLVDVLDGWLLTSHLAPAVIVAASVLAIVYHPNADKWTPTRCLLLASVLLVPLVDVLDGWLLTSHLVRAAIVAASVLAIVYHPNADKWTPTRGDTTMIVSCCAGILTGSWTNYQLGNMTSSGTDPPYPIIWPSIEMLGCTILRTILGFCGVLAARAFGKSFSYALICALLGKDKNELRNSENSLDNKNKIIVELCYKYFTYGLLGFNMTYVLPNVFSLLKINRPTYYTEI